jgi:hypothetical protein
MARLRIASLEANEEEGEIWKICISELASVFLF